MTDQIAIPFPTAPNVMGGAYNAGDRFDRQVATWHPPLRSADADILPDKRTADARSLDANRNDAFVHSGSQLHRDSIVGSMFLLNAKPRVRALGLDDQWAKEFQEEVEAQFTNWAESTNHWVDASRRNTFTSLVRLAVGVYAAAGEVLATAEWLREGDRPYRTAIQMVELSRLCDPQDQVYDRRRVRGGIRLSAQGVPLGYYIRRAAPGGFLDGIEALRWSYVRARNSINRPQVIHIVEQHRPGQTRGMSQLTSALRELWMLRKFRDVSLQNAIINASYAATVESELPSSQIFEALGSGGNDVQAIINYASNFLGAIKTYGDAARNVSIDGTKIPHLMPGTKLNMTPMARPNGVGSEFEKALLRYLSASLGVSFEQLAKDYSETNYSSARAGMLETWKYMQGRKRVVADHFASSIFRLWFEEAVNAGDISTMMAASVPNMYDGLNMEAFTNARWIGAGYGQIDEYKETQAAELRITSGLSTYEIESGRLGYDWREIMRQRAREQEEMQRLGIEVQPSEAQSTQEEDRTNEQERDSRRRDESGNE